MDLLGELHGEFRRYEEELRLLRDIDIEIIRSTFDIGRIFELIITGSIRLLSPSAGHLHGQLLIVKGKMLEIVWSSINNDVGHTVPINESVSGLAVLRRESIIVPDVSTEPLYKKVIPDMQSELAAPLKTNDHILGVINIESKEKFAFKDADKHLLEMLAGQAAIAVQNARLYEDLESVSTFQALVLREDKDLHDVLKSIARIAVERVGAEHCQILSIGNGDLIIQYTTGEEPIGSRVKIDFSVSGKALKSSDGFKYIPNVMQEGSYQRFLPGMISELAVAVKIKDKFVGVINVESPVENAFDSNHIKILRFFADQAAIALSNYFNINERIKAQRKLANSMAMAAIGDRAGNLVHKLHSHLGAIPPLADQLRGLLRGKVEDDLVFELLAKIEESADKSIEIPRKLRDTYAQKDEIKEIDVNKAIENVLLSNKPPKNVDVIRRFAMVPPVNTVNQLEDIIYNVVKNAYEAMPNGGSLTITTRMWEDAPVLDEETQEKIIKNKGVEIEVQDTGVGMEKEELTKIVDPMYTKKIGEEGLGFGLWWVNTFLERIEGEFVPTSEKGSGTKIILRVPFKTKLTI
jgi:GAF domain-containing protein